MPRLYEDLADLWPLLSPPADYEPEAVIVRRVLDETLGPARRGERRKVLELGAGGGHTLHHLRDTCDCVAVDLSEPMLANCRKLNPDVEAIAGDMRSVRLERTFDAVLIHDAIDYMLNETDVRAALHTAAAHLRPGGVALIAPTYTRDTYTDLETEHDQHADEKRVLTYFSLVNDPEPTDTTFELILLYLITDQATGRTGPAVEDRHICGLFGVDEWMTMLDRTGFDAEPRAEAAWDLFVAVKR